MLFKLSFDIVPFKKQLQPDSQLFFAGSCFSENIADLFSQYKFRTESNTHGILYNPLSIAHSLQDGLRETAYEKKDLRLSNDQWISFQHHSRFSHPDADACLDSINTRIRLGNQSLRKADFLFLTFGSAFVYKHLQSEKFVGNCHKFAAKEFEKILLSKETIVEEYKALIKNIRELNPGITIVFTVSPVRYVRDGVAENNLSKGILLQAVNELVKGNDNCIYFPSYEIVNDELRDYRFFEEDLVHPNKMAIQYVWERLVETAFSESSKTYISDLREILKASSHRVFNPASESHKKFKDACLRKCTEFEKRFPHISLSEEKKYFSA